jgi:cytochrome c-type biogenesis protein CcmH/NrfF
MTLIEWGIALVALLVVAWLVASLVRRRVDATSP